MKTIIRNWKTSLIGGGALTTGLTMVINDPSQWKEAVGLCIVGLLGVLAKDGNVTGK